MVTISEILGSRMFLNSKDGRVLKLNIFVVVTRTMVIDLISIKILIE